MSILDWGEAASGEFERGHLRLLEARTFFATEGEVPQELEGALLQLYMAWDEQTDPLRSMRQAAEWLGAVLSPDEFPKPAAVEKALAEGLGAVRGLESMAAARPVLHAPPREMLVATRGAPAVRAIARPVINPSQASQPSLFAKPPDMEGKEGWAPNPLPAMTMEGWRYLRFEELVRDVAICGMNRIPQMGDPWRSALFGEERMLHALDAVLAIEGADLAAVERLFTSSPAPDPALLFAVGLVGGCLAGRDGLAMAERALLCADGDPEFEDALVTAWTMTPHPALDGLARAYAQDAQPARRRLGIRLLVARRTATTEELERAAFDVPAVAASALVPLVLNNPAHLRQRLDELSTAFLDVKDEALADQWLIARVLAGYPHGTVDAGRQVQAGSELGGRLLGIAAEQVDAERLLEWTATEPTPALVEALGWAGDPAALPLLLGLLGVDDDDISLTAAMSLERITGAGLFDEVELPAEAVMDDDPFAEAQPSALADQADPRDPAAEGSPETMELPSRDQERWRAYLAEHQESLIPGARTRRGIAYSPLVSLNELDQGQVTPLERKTLHWEIIVRAGLNAPFDENALVIQQEADIASIKSVLESSPTANPGSWSLPLVRR